MRSVVFLTGIVLSAGLCGCGFIGAGDPAVQVDPYRSAAAGEINAILYTRKSPEKIMAKLGELGVQQGRIFGEFKVSTNIDDWFGVNTESGMVRYTSLSCGLSPVVDDAGRMTGFYRNRKFFGGKMYPELLLTPDAVAGE